MTFTINEKKNILDKRNCLVFEKLLLSIIYPKLMTRQLYSLVNNANIKNGIITIGEIINIFKFIKKNRQIFNGGFRDYIKIINDYIEDLIERGTIELNKNSAETNANNILNTREGSDIIRTGRTEFQFGNNQRFACNNYNYFEKFVILIVYHHILYYDKKCKLIKAFEDFLNKFKKFENKSYCKNYITNYKKLKEYSMFLEEINPYIILSRSEINEDKYFEEVLSKKTSVIDSKIKKNEKKIKHRVYADKLFVAISLTTASTAIAAMQAASASAAVGSIFPPALIVSVTAAGTSAANAIIGTAATMLVGATRISKQNVTDENARLNEERQEILSRHGINKTTINNNLKENKESYFETIKGFACSSKLLVEEQNNMEILENLYNNIVTLNNELEKSLIKIRTYEIVLALNCGPKRNISAVDKSIEDQIKGELETPAVHPYQELIDELDAKCMPTGINVSDEQCQNVINTVKNKLRLNKACNFDITDKKTIKTIKNDLFHQRSDNLRKHFCGRKERKKNKYKKI